jgi:imidazolonepropionase-like amidohydrolase
MTPLEAIQCTTTHAIDLLGVNDRCTIAVGKLADMIAVKGNPLDDITTLQQVRWVRHGGRVVDP